MLDRFDWKFAATLLVTFAGLVVPVVLWRFDVTSKSVELRVISTTALRPKGASSLDGVQVLIDGRAVETPFLSILQIQNIGSRPIATSDFEAATTITTNASTEVVKARLTMVEPFSLNPSISFAASSLVIQPLLLNPNDRFQVAVLTSGSAPEFSASSRIAGVSSISMVAADEARVNARSWARTIVGILLLTMYLNFGLEFVLGLVRRVVTPLLLATALIAFGGGLLLLTPIGDVEVIATRHLFAYFLLAAFISVLVHLVRHQKMSRRR
jgi:hypothetical protein